MGVKIEIRWILPAKAEEFLGQKDNLLGEIHGILVPGGFGERGLDGTLRMIRWARENHIPFLGICLGMQLTVIEAARQLCGLKGANSEEFDVETPHPVVHLLKKWEKGEKEHTYDAGKGLGATMRLGLYPCKLQKGSLLRDVYQDDLIQERHRHRFEVNKAYVDQLESVGLYFSGWSPCGQLPEAVERKDHPFFVAVQFHPEFQSSPLKPHLLFQGFIQKAFERKKS